MAGDPGNEFSLPGSGVWTFPVLKTSISAGIKFEDRRDALKGLDKIAQGKRSATLGAVELTYRYPVRVA